MTRPHSHRTADVYEYRRYRAWELHRKGWKQQRIAEALGVSPGAVSQWLKRATVAGPQSLDAQPRPGRPARLTRAQRQNLTDLLSQGAEAFGFRGAVWTRGRVARLIQEQLGINYHPVHVGRILKQIGWSPQQPLVRASQRDEAAIAAWYDQRWPALKKRLTSKGKPSSG